MLKVFGFRLLRLVGTLLAVSFLTFMLGVALPGDPINAIIPPENRGDEAVVARVTAELKLDESPIVRYGDWLGNAVRGDLGYSYITDQPVVDTIKQRLPITAQLALFATLIAVVVAVPFGVLGGYREGKPIDKMTSIGVQVGLSVPVFIVGIFLIYFFTVKWNPGGFFQSTGWNRISEEGIVANLKTSLLPAIALSLSPMAIYTRLLRSDMIGTLKEDFVLSAKAKGLSNGYILGRHALRPSSLSLITIIGIQIGILLGGTVVTESIFALPGLGLRLLNAIYQRDIIMVQGITVFIATVYVLINTLVDFIYMAIDPRIRRS
jgi:peptide/nickel transport system permease protein